jgi:hypothetical protein
MKRFVFASALIWLFVCLPLIIISVPVVAVMLLTKWSGYTTLFGNEKWGRGHDHFEFATKTYWQEFNWLVLRNPVNNLHSQFLSVAQSLYRLEGNYPIGDKVAGGRYFIKMNSAWEFYYIKPYTVFGSHRCVRLRAGWKIESNDKPRASFVFAINPVKSYQGKL